MDGHEFLMPLLPPPHCHPSIFSYQNPGCCQCPSEMPFSGWCHWSLALMNVIEEGLTAASYPEELSGLSGLKQ